MTNSDLLKTDVAVAQIAAGATGLSEAISIDGRTLVAIYMPSSWVTANLTFQAAYLEDGTYQNVYDSAGNELVVTAAASRVIVDIPELAPLKFLKIRSGTAATPVNQTSGAVIRLILKD